MIIGKQTIFVDKELNDIALDLLSGKEVFSGMGDFETIFTFTAEIPESNFEVDIKVVGCTDDVYIDAVLFEGGHEILCLEPQYDRLEGEYIFHLEDDNQVVVNVKVKK